MAGLLKPEFVRKQEKYVHDIVAVDTYLGHGIFHSPAALLFFSTRNRFLREVLSCQKLRKPQKKVVHPLS